MKIEDGINEIGNLPDIPNWYTPETEEIQAEIDHINKNYYHASLWLKHLMCNDSKPSSELNVFLPFAREIQVLYDLIVAIKLATPGWEGLDAVEMWVQACRSEANFILEQKGVLSAIETGVPNSSLKSKRNTTTHNTNCLRALDIDNTAKEDCMPIEWRKVTREDLKAIVKTDYRHFLESQAFGIALKSSNFRTHYWNPYISVCRAVNNAIHSDDLYQYSYLLPDGTRFITGKHRKLPKGFGEGRKLPSGKNVKKHYKSAR